MKKAIITGATGFIGSTLVRKLLLRNIEVLALGRKNWQDVDPYNLTESKGLTYIQIDMSEIATLPSKAKEAGWDSGDSCVFYNFAWGGISGLSDLDVDSQMNNVTWSANAVHAASELNCQKFVHVGTMEEAFTSKYLSLDFHKNSEYNRHVIYSVAKMVSRNVLKLVSQQNKIDLIVATNSHVMGPNDNKDSFLQVTLGKLINKSDELQFSTGEQMFDVISADDCALAYMKIGEFGKPFSEYWIGSGKPRPLKEYVEIMASLYPSGKELLFGKMPYNDISLMKEDFSIKSLTDDTGFIPSYEYEDAVHELYSWLTENKMTDENKLSKY